MKRLFCLTAFLALALFILPNKIFAQAADTVNVAALPAGNLNNVINSDTLSGGVRAHPNRVYRLKHGAIYQVTEPLKIVGSITIIANDTTAGLRPPVLAPAILADNSSIDHFFELDGAHANVSMSNLYMLSIRADGNQLGWSDGIRVNADSVYLKLRGVIFEGFTEGAIEVHGFWDKFDVQDCNFRNLQHATSYFGGQAFLTDRVTMDTTKFINNTFFCVSSYLWSIRRYCPYAVFEHNTVAYSIVDFALSYIAYNQHIDNNLFYSVHSWGGDPDQVINSWLISYPDTSGSGLITLWGPDTASYYAKLWGGSAAGIVGPESLFPDATHGVTAAMVNPANRVTDVQNNSYYWPTKLTDFIKAYNDTVKTADTVQVPDGTGNEVNAYLVRRMYSPVWMSNYTIWTVDSLFPNLYPNTTISNNIGNQDPGFNADVEGQADKVVTYVRKIITNTLDSTWFYEPKGTLYPPQWPLPENLAYTNATLQHASTDGFAVGDLNWFPTQKAAWEGLTAVEPIPSSIPSKFTLSQNYPNPFNPSTEINYSIPTSGFVSFKVFNILGQEVATLYNGFQKAGSYKANFDASKLASGIYLYRLQSGSFVQTKKMILMK